MWSAIHLKVHNNWVCMTKQLHWSPFCHEGPVRAILPFWFMKRKGEKKQEKQRGLNVRVKGTTVALGNTSNSAESLILNRADGCTRHFKSSPVSSADQWDAFVFRVKSQARWQMWLSMFMEFLCQAMLYKQCLLNKNKVCTICYYKNYTRLDDTGRIRSSLHYSSWCM